MIDPKTADGSSVSEILRDEECVEGCEAFMLREVHSTGRVDPDDGRVEARLNVCIRHGLHKCANPVL